MSISDLIRNIQEHLGWFSRPFTIAIILSVGTAVFLGSIALIVQFTIIIVEPINQFFDERFSERHIFAGIVIVLILLSLSLYDFTIARFFRSLFCRQVRQREDKHRAEIADGRKEIEQGRNEIARLQREVEHARNTHITRLKTSRSRLMKEQRKMIADGEHGVGTVGIQTALDAINNSLTLPMFD